ncbi:MAG: RNA methyltransferase [Tenuifilaceae bacterium]|jgi:tRNA (guanosine-2'-O-)-methyltransferase|nr:RNA methyltransferase [Tenuifilaceae bacterium]
MSLSLEQKYALISHFCNFISEKRLELLKHVLDHRTRYATVVLEDIFQSQNASAVLRSCDCFGVQDVHIIENTNRFNVNPKVVMGASKWLTVSKYNRHDHNTLTAIKALRQNGYRIVATSPHTYVTTLQDFDVEKGKFALLFGTELTGLSQVALDNADEYLMIPTYGFSESLNISVSAALCLQNLTDRLRSSPVSYKLAEEERANLFLEWLRKSIKSSRAIEKRFLEMS